MEKQRFSSRASLPKVNSMAKSSKALVSKQQVRQMIKASESRNDELKMIDTNQTVATVDFSGTIQALTNVAQGNSGTTRDGDEILLDSVDIRGNWGAGDATNLVRHFIVQYFPSATPSVTTFLEVTGSGNTPTSQFERNTLEDYAVLYDSGPINLVLGLENTQHAFTKLGIKIKRPISRFNQAATTGSNQLYFITVSDSGAVPNPSISYNIRVYYRDS